MPPPIFAHLHSSPLVVRHQSDSNWRNLSFHSGVNGSLNGYEAVELIDVKAERRLLLQTLRESGRHLSWQSEVAEVHTFRKILSFGCRVLHFSGHGVPGQVIFETRRGEAQFVSQQELQDLILAGGADDRCLSTRQRNRRQEITELCDERSFRSRSDSTSSDSDDVTSGLSITSHRVELDRMALTAPRMQHEKHNVPLKLVFLSACHSESVAEAFVRAEVPHVVVVSKEKKVLDRKAMEFAKAFYTALFAGHAVAKSFEIGRVQADIVVASNGDNAVDGGRSEFKLLGDGDHNDAPFRDVPAGDLIETDMDGRRGGNVTRNECDAIAEVFVGRSMEVHQVYKALVEGARLVSITGERGIGKTEVALQCAQYATERRVFSHIFYLRLNTGNDGKDASDDLCKQHAELELPLLVSKFAKCLGLQAISLDQLAELARQRCEIENQGDGSSFLLILDGCNRVERQNSCFRTIVAMLLRRVNSLALLLTGDGRFGALDGVGEKIISIGPLPLADAALLFTLRAPRKIKAHEMGSSTDLKTFGEHPIIKSLQGHPRTICAVSQFLEKKDMELDQDEFLSYIIPSVNTGLCMSTVGDSATLDCGLDSRQRLHEQKKLALASNNTEGCYSHSHEHHYHHRQHDGMPSCIVEEARDQHRLDSVQKTVIRRMKPVASQSDVVTAKSLLKVPSTQKMTSDDIENQGIDFPPPHVHPLISARSVPSPTGSITAPTTSLQQQCLLQVAEYVRPVIQSEGGSLVWARAVVIRTTFSNHLNFEGRLKSGYLAAMVHQLQGLQDIPLDWIAPQVSYFFATKLKGDAAKRPLSTRSIDFLSKSSLIWGHKSTAPAQRGGAVTLHMFAAFWAWFRPLVDCILHSTLWPHTEPRLLHGLLSKGDCIRMLERAPSGTFLLRFSETRIRCLVIAYVREDLCVQFVPVTWHPERNGWFVALQAEVRKTDDSENNGVTFSTLQELILSVNVLKFLFPQTPKGVAFTLERQMRQEPEAS